MPVSPNVSTQVHKMVIKLVINDYFTFARDKNDDTTLEVMHVKEGLKEIQSTFPDRPNTLFLRLIMGDVCVNLSDRNDK